MDMVLIRTLWIPILLSAVAAFVTSSIFHMVLPFHRKDYLKIPSEDAVAEALRKANVPPGDYMMPYCGSSAEMKTPEHKEKWAKGPVAFMTVIQNGPPAMGKSLIQWFLYCVVVSVLAAYMASRALHPGDPYLGVFRFAGTTAFIGYSMALAQNSIWYKRSWSTTARSMLDGLIYGAITGGIFGWLWPSL